MENLNLNEIINLLTVLAIAAAVAGFMAGLLGVGGGIIMVPALYYAFTVLDFDLVTRMHLSVGTSLAIIIPTSIISTKTHMEHDAVDFNMVKSFGIFIVLGVICGTFLAVSLKTPALVLFFAIFSFCVGLFFIFLREQLMDKPKKISELIKKISGILIGFISVPLGIGCEVIELDCNLDYTFPRYNPNPEDMEMLHEIAKCVKQNNADVGFGFDGDGDRVGVIDNSGNEIFADKIGLLIARNISNQHKNSKFVVDVKSTGLFMNDEILNKNNCKTIYWKTGHSYIKRKVNEDKAIAGFEKSGHFFFNQPLGYGFDDGINSAIQVCNLLDNQNEKLDVLIKSLPKTFQSPTMGPFCKDEEKYGVIDEMIDNINKLKDNEFKIKGLKINNILTVNGIRFSLEDGSWGLIRASSNKPSLVVVTESPTSDELKKEIFYFIDKLLQETGKIGEYDQKIN